MGKWIFTFGCSGDLSDNLRGHYLEIIAKDWMEARLKMLELYSTHWAFQYTEEEWTQMLNNPKRRYPMETKLKTVTCEEVKT